MAVKAFGTMSIPATDVSEQSQALFEQSGSEAS